MADEAREVTEAELIRDRIDPPGQINAEHGMAVGMTAAEQIKRTGAVIDAPPVSDPGVAGMMGGEFMGPEQRIDGEELREEDVTIGDRLSDDVRENAEDALPGGAQGEDALPHERIDGPDGEE